MMGVENYRVYSSWVEGFHSTSKSVLCVEFWREAKQPTVRANWLVRFQQLEVVWETIHLHLLENNCLCLFVGTSWRGSILGGRYMQFTCNCLQQIIPTVVLLAI